MKPCKMRPVMNSSCTSGDEEGLHRANIHLRNCFILSQTVGLSNLL